MQTKRKTMIVAGAAKGIWCWRAEEPRHGVREGRHPAQRRRLR